MKRAGKMLVIGLFSLLLSGCMFTTPETSLYRLPKLAGEYESLESQIDALLTNGAEYAAPTSGSNLQSVQMIDLDGDGSEEAVAFFRRASDKKPMKIYIFKADGDSYERYAVIEGTSSQIYSVNYADLDGDGLKEILVGYKSSSDVQGLANIGSRFVLTQQVEAVYAARIGDAWNITLDEQSLRERFSLITAEWTMGDN